MSILTLGAGVGQLAVLLAAPVMTRIYSPSEFGIFAVFMSVVGILGPVASLRYEFALLVANDTDKHSLLWLSVIICLAFSVIAGLVVYQFALKEFLNFSAAPVSQYWWLYSFGVFSVGLAQIFSYFATREHWFGLLSVSKALQGVSNVFASIVLGLLGGGVGGLMGGYVTGYVLNAMIFLKRAKCTFGNTVVSCHQLISTAKEYRRYPLFTMPSDVVSAAGLMFPPLALGFLYGAETAGIYALTQRVVGSPLAMVGQAVGQVYIGNASRLWASDTVVFRRHFFNLLVQLSGIGFVVVLLASLVVPEISTMIFGPEWSEMGDYLRVLSVMFFFQFVVSPLSNTLALMGRSGVMFAIDSTRLMLVILSMIFAKVMNWDSLWCVGLVGAANSLAYIFYAAIIGIMVQRGHGHREEIC